eukprot:Awhi_evm1s6665
MSHIIFLSLLDRNSFQGPKDLLNASKCAPLIKKGYFGKKIQDDLRLFGSVENLIKLYGSRCGPHIHKEEFRKHMKEDLAFFGNIENLMKIYRSHSGRHIHKEDFRKCLKKDLAFFGNVENLVKVYGSKCAANIYKEEFRKHMKEDLALFGNVDNLVKVYGSHCGSNIHKEEFRKYMKEDSTLFDICGSHIHKEHFRKYMKDDDLLFGEDLSRVYWSTSHCVYILREPFRAHTLQFLDILKAIDATTAKKNFIKLLRIYRGPRLKELSRLNNINKLLSFCRNDDECKWVISTIIKYPRVMVDIDDPERFKPFIPIDNRGNFDPDRF